VLRRPVRRARDGTYEVVLAVEERELLRSLPGQLRELLTTDDPALERLFPPAYTNDDEKNAEYERLMRSDLTAGRVSALDVLEATADAEVLDEEQLLGWMGAINDLRLVLGTRLDVSEEMYTEEVAPDDPNAPAMALYLYLGFLLESIVDALSGSF
jgi:hypothetical protein